MFSNYQPLLIVAARESCYEWQTARVVHRRDRPEGRRIRYRSYLLRHLAPVTWAWFDWIRQHYHRIWRSFKLITLQLIPLYGSGHSDTSSSRCSNVVFLPISLFPSLIILEVKVHRIVSRPLTTSLFPTLNSLTLTHSVTLPLANSSPFTHFPTHSRTLS